MCTARGKYRRRAADFLESRGAACRIVIFGAPSVKHQRAARFRI